MQPALRLILASVGRRAPSAGAASLLESIQAAAAGQPGSWARSCCPAATAAAAAAAGGALRQQLLPAAAAASFHASAAARSSALASVLSKEIKHEKTVYEQDELVAAGPPAPFELHSAPGDTAVSLARDYGAGERVTVDCSVNMQDSLALPFGDEEGSDGEGGAELDGDMEQEQEDAANDVNFNVTVTKGERALVFECVSDGTYVDVRHVSLEPAEGIDSETAFTGPVFSELDDELQGAFREYLRERGVTEDLGEYLRHLMYDKEQQEYMHWLEGVKSFVSSG